MGFYSGSLPNLTRCIVRNSYKYPLMIGLPNQLRWIENEATRKLVTGASVALIEATVTCPLERLKVYFMTQNRSSLSYFDFFRKHNDNLWKELFRGFTPLFARQLCNWTVLLQTDYTLK